MVLQNTIQAAISEIVRLNAKIANFWSDARGCAPPRAYEVLSRSRLERQVSLSKTLDIWVTPPTKELSDGELILAWANLGSLLEGTMKTLLAVYAEDYLDDLENARKAGAVTKNGISKPPDSLTLEQLKIYFREQRLLTETELRLVERIQKYRNVLHAFKDSPLGNQQEFLESILGYAGMLKGVELRLPSPDNF